MWRFKPFSPKEAAGLEGRCIDVGNLKVQIKNIIAEGGFSCVYLARDAVNPSKQYAVKHIICNDQESLELVKKEISVMKSLKGHPNVVALYAHSIFDMGRTKEAFLVLEFCEKSLVNFLESRGAGYLEETQILKIFRDVCNAVFALHCQSPPIAHRDLKAENILLESNGSWKLCDFGSTSTNHKCFERPEEMGIEEDNIRKHTTPAYRAPEMWDLFRRDLINEKVDIWALGCLLFRICYFKSAFDGESKLQVLNGNYRIPDLPKYSSSITDLVRDMLQSSPDARPDITQVWFRVNQKLPVGLQQSLPDRPPEMHQVTDEGMSKPKNNAAVPHRTPTNSSKGSAESNGPLGAFWASQHAQDSLVGAEKTSQRSDNESITYSTSKQDHVRIGKHHSPGKTSPSLEEKVQVRPSQRISSGESLFRPKDDGSANDFVARFPKVDPNHNNERSKESRLDNTETFQDEAFNTFVADFNTARLNARASFTKPEKDSLVAEVEKLREQLTQANSEKAELASKYEKLSTICRSQQQEIVELKQALGGRNQLPNKGAAVKSQSCTGNVVQATAQQVEVKPWNAFPDESSPQAALKGNKTQFVTTRSDHQHKTNAPGVVVSSSSDGRWGFGADTFTATPTSSSSSRTVGNSFQRRRDSNNGDNKPPSQPAGWAGF